MEESFEEEDPAIEQPTSSTLLNEDERNDAVEDNTDALDEVDEHADEGPGSSHYSEAFDEASQLSPSRDVPDDEIHCANCSNYRDNTIKAFEAAATVSKLQAQYSKMTNKYEELCKNNASASMLVENTYNKLRDTEMHRDRLQGELNVAESDNKRLIELNEQYLDAARDSDKHRQYADGWRKKYIQSQSVLLDKAQKYDALEEKYRNSVDLVKTTLGLSNENAKKLINTQDKLNQKDSDHRMMKKTWTSIVKLISDISSKFSDQFPDDIRERVRRLSLDELLQVAKPTDRGADDSDDDAAERVQLLINLDSGDSHVAIPGISQKSNGASSGRGNRGGRGVRAESFFTKRGGRNIVDESMHENLLSRKLHKSGLEHATAAPSHPAAMSVMGKKTETVREQQERQKAGLKDKIAELKKNAAAASEKSKGALLSGPNLEDDMMMSDDDNDSDPDDEVNELPAQDAVPSGPSTDYDLDMPDFGGADDEGGGVKVFSSENQSTGSGFVEEAPRHGTRMPIEPLCASTIPGTMEDLRSTAVIPAIGSHSPTKMIQHPMVVELSQERDEMDVLRCVNPSKKEQRRQESLAALGMDMSDSDESEDEDAKKNEDTEKNIKLLFSMRTPLKSPPKSPQKSPLSIEKPPAGLILQSPANNRDQLGVSRRINKAERQNSVHSNQIVASIEQVSTSSTSAQPVGSTLLDDILTGAHQSNTVSLKNRKALPRKVIPEEIKKKAVEIEKMSGIAKEPVEETSVIEEEETPQPGLRRSSRARSHVMSPAHIPKTSQKRSPLKKPPSMTAAINVSSNVGLSLAQQATELILKKKKVKETAARLRGEATAAATAPLLPARSRKVPSAPVPDDTTPFSRNSRRTTVAAPRVRSTAMSSDEAVLSVGSTAMSSDEAVLSVGSMPSDEAISSSLLLGSSLDGEIFKQSAKKRVARMCSSGDVPSTSALPDTTILAAGVEVAASHDAIETMDDDDASGEMEIAEDSEKEFAPPVGAPVLSLPATTMECMHKVPLLIGPSSSTNFQPKGGGEEVELEERALDELECVSADKVNTNKSIAAEEPLAEIEPGSCIVDDTGGTEELCAGRSERETVSTPTLLIDDDYEPGDLMIDSGPNSPAATPPPISPMPPIMNPEVSEQPILSMSAADIQCPVNPPESSIVTTKPGPVHLSKQLCADSDSTVHERCLPSSTDKLASAGRSAKVVVPSLAPPAQPILPTQSLEEKRRTAIAAMHANRGRVSTRGGRGGTTSAGGRQSSGTNHTRRGTSSANGSRTSTMEAQMAKMSKNLLSGKLAMSGRMRPLQSASVSVPPADAASSRQLPVLPSQRKPLDSSVKSTAVAIERGKAVLQKKSNEPRALKRKANVMSSVDAVAIRAPDARMRGQSATTPSTASAVGAGNSPESCLITAVLNVCRHGESVEKAMQQMDISMLRVDTIAKCVCKALAELPQSNTWNVVCKNMGMDIETVDRNKVIPIPERKLFELLMKMHETGDSMMFALFEKFFETYCRAVLRSISSSNTTADVTRNVRCLFFALFLTDRSDDEKVEEGRKLFHQILQKKSSQAVCQSLVYLLWQKDTASLVSDILRTELNDDVNGGRLISMHMNYKKDAQVLYWAVEKFANNSCKSLSTAAFRTPATLQMVQRWWDDDMKTVEKVENQPDSVTYTSSGALKVNTFYKELMVRMPVLISPQLRVDGLDRVKLLEQLDTPAIDAVDRVTANRIEDTGSVSIFTDTSSFSRSILEAGEARVIVLKMHIAMAALTSFYTDRMYEADQREALRLHLLHSIERVHSILRRPSADLSSSAAIPENGLYMGLRAIMKWRDVVQRLTHNDLMNIPDSSSVESTPIKKKPRCESYDVADQSIV